MTTNGLPSARFTIPTSNDFTPFTRPVYLALNDPARPLRSVSDSTAGNVAVTLNANFPTWRASLSARYEQRERKFEGQQTGLIPGGAILVDDLVNPFDGNLAGLIPTRTRISSSRTRVTQLSLETEGPLIKLPAGEVRLRTAFGYNRTTLDAMDETLGMRTLERSEVDAEVGLSIPLTGREPAFLPALGEMDVAVEAGQTNLHRFGKVRRHSLALNWKPVAWLRFTASHVSNERAPPPEFLAAATQISENVPYFDPLTGQSVNVTTIFGGNPNLLNETQRTRTFSMALTPSPKYNMLISADYSESELRNQLGALPPPSTAVALAFPDRFVRDGNGTLVLVDNRSVNFERQRNRQLRLGLGMAIPLGKTKPPGTARGPRTTLQLNASHTILLDSKTMIRAGLGEIDLLKGGAVGLAGGQQRHSSDASLALNKGNTGLRVTYTRRGGNLLAFGTPAAPSLLTFAPSSRLDVKAFVDVGKLLPKVRFARNMRLSVACENVFNRRQGVTSSSGAVPFGFQSAYREPVGRTIGVELRMVV